MVVGRKIIAVFVGALAITATVHADMMSASELDADACQSASNLSDFQQSTLPGLFGSPDLINSNSLHAEFLPEAAIDGLQSGEVLRPQNFRNSPSSLNLCLCALLGAGLFKSTHRLKRLSFGIIPDWYHDSGPYQIGHSRVISPDCLSSVPCCWFTQPHSRVSDCPPLYRLATIMSLWRPSQYSPVIIASCGPPMSAESRV